MRGFRLPTRVVIEDGCRRRLPEALRAVETPSGAAVVLVIDAGLGRTPWPDQVEAEIRREGWRCLPFDGVESNPRSSTVEALADLARTEGASAVVGLGGGSVLDAAKAAAMLATNGGACLDYEGPERFSRSPLPFIALPTTCGTGSEVTWVSVVSVEEEKRKISIKGHGMFPDVALVDADLVATLPPHLVAWTGLDALTHALEAVTVNLSNPASDALAARAVETLLADLPRAVADTVHDGEARRAVMTASTVAGMAFGNADVGAVHCLSETLGGLYDVPHGLANALLLVPVLRSHGEAAWPGLAGIRRFSQGSAESRAQSLLDEVEALVESLKLPDVSALGIRPEDRQEIARRAVTNGSNPSNPRPMGEEEYLSILDSLS